MEYVEDYEKELLELIEEHGEEYRYLTSHVVPILKLIKRTLQDEGFSDEEVEKLTPIVASKTLKDRYYWKKNKQTEGNFTRGDRYD